MSNFSDKDFSNLAAVWMLQLHTNSVSKGFWDNVLTLDMPVLPSPDNDPHISRRIMLVVEELVEAHTELRENTSSPTPLMYCESGCAEPCFDSEHKPAGFLIEIIDAVFRLSDLASSYGSDNVANAISWKFEYNKGRPHLHGKKF